MSRIFQIVKLPFISKNEWTAVSQKKIIVHCSMSKVIKFEGDLVKRPEWIEWWTRELVQRIPPDHFIRLWRQNMTHCNARQVL